MARKDRCFALHNGAAWWQPDRDTANIARIVRGNNSFGHCLHRCEVASFLRIAALT